MYTGRTLFSQVMDFVPWTSFNRIVAKYRGDRDTRTLRCTEHFRVMAFAQVTYRESLRDIEACLGAQPAKLCSMGLRGPVAKSTLADANELRDWRIWSDLAAVLIKRARKLYLKEILVSTLPTRSTRSTALRLIYVFRCFRAPIFVRQKPQSKCTHCSICAGQYPVLSIFQRVKWVMPWPSI